METGKRWKFERDKARQRRNGLSRAVRRLIEPRPDPVTIREPAKPAAIYVIQCGGDRGPVKIGYATDPFFRMSNLQVGNHQELQLVAYAFCCDYEEVEAMLHERFKHLCIRGEWFTWNDEIAELIGQIGAVRNQSVSEYLAHRSDRSGNVLG